MTQKNLILEQKINELKARKFREANSLISPAVELDYSTFENKFETKVWANRDDFARVLIYFLKNLQHGCTMHLKVVNEIPVNQNPYSTLFGDKIYSVVTEQNKRDRIDLFKCWD